MRHIRKGIYFLVGLLYVSAIAYGQAVSTVHDGFVITPEAAHDIAFYENHGPYALVAGGSKGIGYAIAHALAKRDYNLILVARHADSLIAAKQKIESEFHVHVELFKLDLEDEKTVSLITQWCTEKHIPLKILCNVAALGGVKDYLLLPLDSLRYMVNLNIGSEITLCMALLPLLQQNAPAYILNVASMAGFAPIPVKNLYSATKSATIFFSYSLKYQLKNRGINVSCLCPGPVFTKPEIVQDTKEKLGWWGMRMAVPPWKVGEVAVRKTLRKKMIIIPGVYSKLTSIPMRILPKSIVVPLLYRMGEKSKS